MIQFTKFLFNFLNKFSIKRNSIFRVNGQLQISTIFITHCSILLKNIRINLNVVGIRLMLYTNFLNIV